MRDLQYKKARRRHHRKAFFFTILIHVLVIGALAVGTQSEIDWQEYVPEPVKEWLDMKPSAEEAVEQDRA
ncbi:MAG: hypothetical protein AAFV95_08375 [Bacteroidota bacterium]